MQPEHVDRFIALVFAGGGLFLVGFVNLFAAPLGGRLRAALTVLVCVGVVGGAAAWTGNWAVTRLAAAVVLGGMIVGLVLESSLMPVIVRTVGSVLSRSSVRWGSLSTTGLAVVALSSIAYDREDEAWVARNTDEMLDQFDDPSLGHVPVAEVRLMTDRGTAVPLTECPVARPAADLERMERRSIWKSGHADFIMRLHPADDRANCFGWVFAAGQYYIDGRHVDMILSENDYRPVADPRPGDLVVFRWQGLPTHAGIVRYVTQSQPVLVEGKWGWEGVYLHPVTRSNFGTEYTYYRSPRSGHLLRQSIGNAPRDVAN